MNKPIKFSKFLIQADILSKSIGLIPFDDETNPPKCELFLKVVFLINFINMNFVLISEMIYVLLAMVNGNNFVAAIMNLSYAGFVFVGDIKIICVLLNKPLLTILMRELRKIYPQDVELQKSYKIREYVIRFNLVSLGFVIIHQILLWVYNLYTAVSYLIYEYWLQTRIVPRILPYNCWVPWKWEGHWSYYLLYVSHDLAGVTCMFGQLANDLLLCVVATHFIMHYRYLAKRIENYEPVEDFKPNHEFLKNCIEYHQNLLNLSVNMNEVFGVSLLVNFISSSFIICFLGFQITIGVELDVFFMLFTFLGCSLVQILMICYYGQELIKNSESIGHAVYKHKWLNTDLRYRKMLVLIIQRSQKPVFIKATSFLNVSLSTMTDLLQISYKFFALLRTLYTK